MNRVPETVERHLRQVTWLLPPTAARAVREEILANLYCARLDAEISGQTEAQAWQTALSQFGSPWVMALRFARIYTLGWLLRGLLIGAALGGAAYAVQTTAHPAVIQHQSWP